MRSSTRFEAPLHWIGIGCAGISAFLDSCSTKILEVFESAARGSAGGGVREAY